MEERLDRAFIKNSCLNMYPQVLLLNLFALIFIILQYCCVLMFKMKKIACMFFIFENKWKAEPTLKAIVESVWSDSDRVGVLDKLQSCSLALDR